MAEQHERPAGNALMAMAPVVAWIREKHVKEHDSDVVDIDHGPIVEWDYCGWCYDHGEQCDLWPCKFVQAADAFDAALRAAQAPPSGEAGAG